MPNDQGAAAQGAFTPGDWQASEGLRDSNYRHEVVCVSPRGKRIVIARVPVPSGHPEQADANTNVLAAAKDLYEVVRDLLADFEALGAESFHEREARAALAKADGKAAP